MSEPGEDAAEQEVFAKFDSGDVEAGRELVRRKLATWEELVKRVGFDPEDQHRRDFWIEVVTEKALFELRRRRKGEGER